MARRIDAIGFSLGALLLMVASPAIVHLAKMSTRPEGATKK